MPPPYGGGDITIAVNTLKSIIQIQDFTTFILIMYQQNHLLLANVMLPSVSSSSSSSSSFVPSQTPALSSAKYSSTYSVGLVHGMYHGITAHRCTISDDISTMEFTDFLCITMPQIPRFYRTELANHKQRSNAPSERLHLKLSASGSVTQLNSKLESTPHGHESERIHGHFYTHRHTEI